MKFRFIDSNEITHINSFDELKKYLLEDLWVADIVKFSQKPHTDIILGTKQAYFLLSPHLANYAIPIKTKESEWYVVGVTDSNTFEEPEKKELSLEEKLAKEVSELSLWDNVDNIMSHEKKAYSKQIVNYILTRYAVERPQPVDKLEEFRKYVKPYNCPYPVDQGYIELDDKRQIPESIIEDFAYDLHIENGGCDCCDNGDDYHVLAKYILARFL